MLRRSAIVLTTALAACGCFHPTETGWVHVSIPTAGPEGHGGSIRIDRDGEVICYRGGEFRYRYLRPAQLQRVQRLLDLLELFEGVDMALFGEHADEWHELGTEVYTTTDSDEVSWRLRVAGNPAQDVVLGELETLACGKPCR